MLFSFLQRFFQFRDQSDEVKPFLQHMEELRWMLIKAVVTVFLCMGGCLFFRKELVHLARVPLDTVDPEMGGKLITLGVVDSLTISFKLAFYAGIVVSFPLLLLYVAQFVVPALTRKEKKYLIPGILLGFGLFLSGVLLCYFFVLPQTLEFFFQDAKNLFGSPSWTVRDYFSFVTNMLLAFGLAFELPIVVMALVGFGFISFDLMNRTRPYAITLLLILAAVIAPTPDPMTFLAMAAPLCLLYEACIWLAWLIDRRRTRRLELPPKEEAAPPVS